MALDLSRNVDRMITTLEPWLKALEGKDRADRLRNFSVLTLDHLVFD